MNVKQFQVYENGRLEENWDGTEDDDDNDNGFRSIKEYFFKVTTSPNNKTTENDDGIYEILLGFCYCFIYPLQIIFLNY